jgi:hypothetical protein
MKILNSFFALFYLFAIGTLFYPNINDSAFGDNPQIALLFIAAFLLSVFIHIKFIKIIDFKLLYKVFIGLTSLNFLITIVVVVLLSNTSRWEGLFIILAFIFYVGLSYLISLILGIVVLIKNKNLR